MHKDGKSFFSQVQCWEWCSGASNSRCCIVREKSDFEPCNWHWVVLKGHKLSQNEFKKVYVPYEADIQLYLSFFLGLKFQGQPDDYSSANQVGSDNTRLFHYDHRLKNRSWKENNEERKHLLVSKPNNSFEGEESSDVIESRRCEKIYQSSTI